MAKIEWPVRPPAEIQKGDGPTTIALFMDKAENDVFHTAVSLLCAERGVRHRENYSQTRLLVKSDSEKTRRFSESAVNMG